MGKREKEYESINLKPVPAGSTPPLMRVMWMTADSIKHIDTHCVGDAKAAKYRGELQTAYAQSKTACEQLTSGGLCAPNPYDGTITPEMAATEKADQARRQAAAVLEQERLNEQKRVQDINNITKGITNLMQTLQDRKNAGRPGGVAGECPGKLNMVNGRCVSGAMQ